MQLRPYQETALAAVSAEVVDGSQATLMVMPTGTGKTAVFSEFAARCRRDFEKPVLVLAHRSELLDQAIGALRQVGLTPRIEKAAERAAGSHYDAVVASVQTLCQPKRLAAYDRDHFGLIITDEAHHSPNRSYKAIYDHFSSAFHLGVTATPNRHDEIGLKNIFETCAFQYTIQQAIADGWLCRIRGQQIAVDSIHLDQIRIIAGDFSQPEMDAMLRDEETLQGMVVPTLEHAGDRPTIVFTPGVEHAEEITKCFNRLQPNSATFVHGSMKADDRRENIALYKSGKRQFIVNVGVLIEGFDYPPTACIALFRPTRSLGLFAQMIGRGTRLAIGKDDCLVLDFVGVQNTVRTVTVMDVLDGTVLNDAEHKKAQDLQAGGMDAIDALMKAKQFVAGLDSIRVKTRALITANAFDVLKMFAVPNSKGLYGGDKATDKQRTFLTGRGIVVPPDLEKGEASRLIDTFIQRQKAGLATFKQIRLLRRLGYQDNFIENLTFELASAAIEQRMKNKNSRKAAV